LRYLDVAYPGTKPADWEEWRAALVRNLREHGSITAARKMAMSQPRDAQAALSGVRCPALIIMGSQDPDWPDPRTEAAAIVALLPKGLGRYVMIEGAGHYPNAQFPQQVAAAIVPFLADHVRHAGA
jgi:pimeloyl-ACP methyl ester carboxylesterase